MKNYDVSLKELLDTEERLINRLTDMKFKLNQSIKDTLSFEIQIKTIKKDLEEINGLIKERMK